MSLFVREIYRSPGPPSGGGRKRDGLDIRGIGYSTSIAFSGNGDTVAIGTMDGQITLFDVSSRQPISPPLLGHKKAITGVVFSPDGASLLSGSKDGALFIWDIDADSWQRRACQIAGRSLSKEEWLQFLASKPYRKTCND